MSAGARIRPAGGLVAIRGGRTLVGTGWARKDVLVAAGRIVHVGEVDGLDRLARIDGLVSEVDASDKLLLPGIVDQHCHPTGGGGGAGFASQNLPLMFEDFTTAGITTAVGVLGNDTVSRPAETLHARIGSLRCQGLNALMMTGEIGYPPVTLTGDITRDMVLIPEIRGCKVSVGDPGSIADVSELGAVLRAVARGARAGQKRPLVHIHLGSDPSCLSIVEDAVRDRNVDPSWITVTHVNWNERVLARAIEVAASGVRLDVTACIVPSYFPQAVRPVEALAAIDEAGLGDRVSVTSDSGGSHPGDDGYVVHEPSLLLGVLRDGLGRGLSPRLLLSAFCSLPAGNLGLGDVGAIEPGARGDLLLIDESGAGPVTVMLGGEIVVKDGAVLRHDVLSRNR